MDHRGLISLSSGFGPATHSRFTSGRLQACYLPHNFIAAIHRQFGNRVVSTSDALASDCAWLRDDEADLGHSSKSKRCVYLLKDLANHIERSFGKRNKNDMMVRL